MNNSEKIAQLRAEIRKIIKPLITSDCHLTNLPYHTNIGDSLIWHGSRAFITECGYNILSETSSLSWKNSRVKPQDIIIFNGGGNIGDIYRKNVEFMLGIIDRFPNNKIIIFPNSAWYFNNEFLQADAIRLSKHKNLHIIARDQYSYDLIKANFTANFVYIAPDMAFYIPNELLEGVRSIIPKPNSTLYLRRVDKEFVPETEIIVSNAKVSDWPTISSNQYINKIYPAINRLLHLLKLKRVIDFIGHHIVRDNNLKIGAKYIATFENIITTRLHTLILSVLIGRPVQYIDNISGKVSAFANTWLSDLSSIKPYEQ